MGSILTGSALALDFIHRVFEAAWIIDEDSRILFANPAAERLTGYEREELVGQCLTLLLPPEVAARHCDIIRSYFARSDPRSSVLDTVREFTVVSKAGEVIPIELTAFELPRNDGARRLGALMHDIRERRALQQRQSELLREISIQARTDELTGLLNRRALLDRIKEARGLVERHARPVVVAMADVDQFKQVNDTHGHVAGDRALQHIAQVMRSKLRSENIVGRLGGDEFGLMFPECEIPQAWKAAEEVRSAIERTPLQVAEDTAVSLTLSVGLAPLLPGPEPIEHALRRADSALYDAKAAGRDQVMAYGDEDAPDLALSL